MSIGWTLASFAYSSIPRSPWRSTWVSEETSCGRKKIEGLAGDDESRDRIRSPRAWRGHRTAKGTERRDATGTPGRLIRPGRLLQSPGITGPSLFRRVVQCADAVHDIPVGDLSGAVGPQRAPMTAASRLDWESLASGHRDSALPGQLPWTRLADVAALALNEQPPAPSLQNLKETQPLFGPPDLTIDYTR
jgi:hypothetical protein